MTPPFVRLHNRAGPRRPAEAGGWRAAAGFATAAQVAAAKRERLVPHVHERTTRYPYFVKYVTRELLDPPDHRTVWPDPLPRCIVRTIAEHAMIRGFCPDRVRWRMHGTPLRRWSEHPAPLG